MDNNKLDIILKSVEKPARYTGGELNSIYKEPKDYKIHFAFCFPDVYEVGMSHLGTRILYDVLNARDDCFCERCFTPWPDFEEQLLFSGEKLFTLESRTPLDVFDFVAFTLQHEMSYTNIVNMLNLSSIPLYTKDRDDSHPLIMAGGPCAYNVEPMADFFDIVVLGEGEYINNTIMDEYAKHKKEKTSRQDFFNKLATYQGIYIPSLYDIKNDGNTFKEATPIGNAPKIVHKVIVDDLNKSPWPKKPILPFLQLIHDRVTLEIFRGCTRGCRFCQAGMIYRPVREKSVETLVSQAKENIQATGYDEISLSSLSSGDYTCLNELILGLSDELKEGHICLSLPSLRIDAHAKEYMESLDMKRKAGLTLAPEAGSQRLRDVINKGVSEKDLVDSVRDAFTNGYSSVKLYFMLGLPTETYEDIKAIAHLANLVRDEYYKVPKEQRKGGLRIVISSSCFIPKPHTPFQWYTQDSIEIFQKKQVFLKESLKSIKGVVYNYHDAYVSRIEAIFAKGDRRLSQVVAKAVELGCKFDSWSEHFSYPKWVQAFAECSIDMDDYFSCTPIDAPLPWDHTSCSVSKEFLQNEWNLATKEIITQDCRKQCIGCGVDKIANCKIKTSIRSNNCE